MVSRNAAASASASAGAQANEAATLRAANAGLRADNEALRGHVEALSGDLADTRAAFDAARAQWATEREMAAREMSHYEGRLALGSAGADEAVRQATAELASQLAELQDERDDLAQRGLFVERQLAKLRDAIKNQRTVALDHLATQTDEPWPEERPLTPAGSELQAEAAPETVTPAASTRKRGPAKRKAGFAEIVYSDKPGRIRTKGYVLKIIAQIYADKLVADAICDRDGESRLLMPEYIYGEGGGGGPRDGRGGYSQGVCPLHRSNAASS